MPWDARGTRRYFYHRRKVAGRLLRTYVGTGPTAEAAAAADAARRAEREQRWAMNRTEKRRLAAPDEPQQELHDLCSLLLKATLLANGFHQHDGGDWRRRRPSPPALPSEEPDA